MQPSGAAVAMCWRRCCLGAACCRDDGLPRFSLSFCAMIRAAVSRPAGGKPTVSVAGRLGTSAARLLRPPLPPLRAPFASWTSFAFSEGPSQREGALVENCAIRSHMPSLAQDAPGLDSPPVKHDSGFFAAIRLPVVAATPPFARPLPRGLGLGPDCRVGAHSLPRRNSRHTRNMRTMHEGPLDRLPMPIPGGVLAGSAQGHRRSHRRDARAFDHSANREARALDETIRRRFAAAWRHVAIGANERVFSWWRQSAPQCLLRRGWRRGRRCV